MRLAGAAEHRLVAGLACIFPKPMETAKVHHVRERGLQPNTPLPVGRVPSRGVGCEILGLEPTQRMAGIVTGLSQLNDIFDTGLRSFPIGNRHVRDQSDVILPSRGSEAKGGVTGGACTRASALAR